MAIHTEVFSDPDNDRTIIKRTEDFTGVIDTCKAMHNEGIHGHADLRLMGHLPGILIEKYCADKNITWAEFFGTDKKHVKAMMNDPDLSYFRVAPGRM